MPAELFFLRNAFSCPVTPGIVASRRHGRCSPARRKDRQEAFPIRNARNQPDRCTVSKLFSPITMRDVTFDNRVVVSPMCQYISEDGLMNDWHLMHLGQFALGGSGLVFTEATHVSGIGRITPKCAGIWNDAQEASIKRVVDFCKEHGLAKMGIQLAHAGRKASTATPNDGGQPVLPEDGGWQTIAPSGVPFDPSWPAPRAMSEEDMETVKQEFVEATRRSDRIGFDVVEVHGGHGYLLNQFFSPLANRRNDQYGGPVENRIRFPLEVFKAMREVWPSSKPMGVRISASDWVDGGNTVEDTIVYAKALQDLGCDFIDVTSGGVDSRQKITVGKSYQVPFAAAVKKAIDIPVMAVGMITDPQQAEDIVANGEADFTMLARGMMYNPHWAFTAALALGEDIPYPPQYKRARPSRWPEAFGLTKEPRVTTDQRA